MTGFGKQNKSKKKRVIEKKTNSLTEKLINEAFNLHSQGSISEAAKYYRYFINQGFNDHRVFSNYAGILHSLGEFQAAESSLRKAIKIKPDYANAHYNLGNILIDLGKSNDAELSYRKAIEIKPDYADAYLNLGNILSELGKLEEAESLYRKAIEIKSDYADAHYNLGKILSDLGKLEDAEFSYCKAIKIKPDYADAHLDLGNIFNDLGKSVDAELSYRKAIEIKPDYADAYLNLGFLLRDHGRIEESINLLKIVLESRSMNKGYKLSASLLITISNLLKEDYVETLLNLNKTTDLINQGAINLISDEKNKNYTIAFFEFITSLYPLLKKDNNKSDLKTILHFGESHCLSFSHQTISLSSQLKKIQPVLITGGKAWHFANKKINQWKVSLSQQIKKFNYSNEIFISFGEIDCRKNEGILNYAIKKDKDVSELCEKTVKGYLDYMEEILTPIYPKKYYFGVPAPTIEKELLDELDIKRIKMIKIYNSILKREVLSRGSYFLDVYKLTSNSDGVNNNIYMCDKIHLSPRCLSVLFETYLFKS